MKLSTILLIGAAGYIGFTLKKKNDAKVAAAKAAAAQAPAPPQPITDSSNTVTSIQRTVNDPGTNTDNPTLDDQNYAGGSSSTSSWGAEKNTGWGNSWGSYRS